MDRRVLVLVGIGASTALCASYPFIHNVPALVLLGATEALGFAAAMPAVQSLLSQGSLASEVGRVQGLFATSQTACTAVAAAAAGAAFAVASWLPFVTVAALCALGLAVATAVWWTVPGRVDRSASSPSTPSAGARPVVTPPQVAVAVPVAVSVADAVGVSVDVQ
jgi:DHA1 family multidrug resistance protein-like MFS transporter